MQICQSCEFENPRAWNHCARCGSSLDEPGGAPGEFVARDATLVSRSTYPPPNQELEGADLPEESPTLAESSEDEDLGPTPLIGQVQAASAIHKSIDHAFSTTKTTLLVLRGERGSGRTRLLIHASEVAARVDQDVRILFGSCRGGGADGSYAPLSRVLLDRFGVTPSSAPSVVRGQMATTVAGALKTSDAISVAETTHLLGFLAGVPFPDSPFLEPLKEKHAERHQRVTRAMCRFFEGDAGNRPTLLVLDNMHHAEAEVLEVLSGLAQVETRLCIILAGAEDTLENNGEISASGGFTDIKIPPLGADDIGGMLSVLLPDLVSAPEPLVSAVLHKTAGNPSALIELVRSLHESGLFIETDEGLITDLGRLEDGDLPISIEDAVSARLSRITDLERETLDRASIMGESFWDWGLLSQVRSEGELEETDDPLHVWPDDTDIQAMHGALQSLLDKGFISYVEGSSVPGAHEFCFGYAGTRDIVYTEMEESVRTLRHAAVARWLQSAGEFEREAVAAMIAPHLEQAGLGIRAGRAYLEAASYAVARARTTVANRYVQKALPLIDSDDVLRKLEALHIHGSVLTTLGEYDEALQCFTEMLKQAWRIGARGKAGAALNRLARIHRQRGDEELSHAYVSRALDLFRSAGDVRGVAASLDDMAQLALLRGEPQSALPAVGEALELRRSLGDPRGQALSLNTAAQIYMHVGDFEQAESHLVQALQMRQSVGDRAGVIQSSNALGVLAFERNHIDAAIDHWTAALSEASEIADRRTECFLLNNLGEARMGSGQLDAARTCLERARVLAHDLRDKRSAAEVERNLGLVLLKIGDGAAEGTLVRALELAEGYGSGEAIAFAHRAMGTMRAQTLFDDGGTEVASASESFLTSVDIFRASGNEKEAARSLSALGHHLIERGDLEGAKERLREARGVMKSLGLNDAVDIDKTLHELG